MVSIIVLSYNTKDLLKQCLESLYKHLSGFEFEVIVVDNASVDGSVQEIKNQKSKIKNLILIKNKQNYGFSKGNNIGAEHAKNKYLLFLNSDTKFFDNSIDDMIEFIDGHDNIGILGGILENPDGMIQRSFGGFYNLLSVFIMLFGREKWELARYKADKAKPVDWVSGGFMLVKSDLFKKLEGFDEHFFMYVEDMEFCYRVKKAGFEVYVFPKAKVKHLGQGSSNRSFAIVNIYKGLLYFYKKHKSYWEYMLVKFMLQTKASAAIIIGIMTHNSYLTSTYRRAAQILV